MVPKTSNLRHRPSTRLLNAATIATKLAAAAATAMLSLPRCRCL
jgi:hypothetical protein